MAKIDRIVLVVRRSALRSLNGPLAGANFLNGLLEESLASSHNLLSAFGLCRILRLCEKMHESPFARFALAIRLGYRDEVKSSS